MNSFSIRAYHMCRLWAMRRTAQSRSIQSRFTAQPVIRRGRLQCNCKCACCLWRWRDPTFLPLSDETLGKMNLHKAANAHRSTESAWALHLRNVLKEDLTVGSSGSIWALWSFRSILAYLLVGCAALDVLLLWSGTDAVSIDTAWSHV